MSWYLLKNRRHVGPFSKDQLEVFKSSGQIDPSDFVISVEELDQGNISYKAITEVIRFTPALPPSKKPTSVPAPGVPAAISSAVAAAVAGDENYQPPLASFTDEEIMNSEVSRIFTQLVDSVDLVQGTNTSVMPPRRPSGKTQHGIEPKAPLPADVIAPAPAEEESLSTFAQYSKMLRSPTAMVALGVLLLGSGIFYFAGSGAFEKGLKGLGHSAASVAKSATSGSARSVIAHPLRPERTVASPQGPIRLPAARELPPPESPRPNDNEETAAPPAPAAPPRGSRHEFRRPGSPELPELAHPANDGVSESADAPQESAAPPAGNANRNPDSVDSAESNENNNKNDANAPAEESKD